MTVDNFVKASGFKVIALPSPEKEIDGVYIGDLLSWVMGRLDADNAWVTIMSNVNIIAVATLADPSCIILSEGVELEEDVLNRAKQQGINVLTTAKTTFSVCADIGSI